MEPDLNRYDMEHVTADHPRMGADQWKAIYHRAWEMYYSPEHVRTLLRRAERGGGGMRHIAAAILAYHGSYRFEGLHPLQCGLLRRKIRATRRPGMPRREPPGFLSAPRVGNSRQPCLAGRLSPSPGATPETDPARPGFGHLYRRRPRPADQSPKPTRGFRRRRVTHPKPQDQKPKIQDPKPVTIPFPSCGRSSRPP